MSEPDKPAPLVNLSSITTDAAVSVISPASFAAADRFERGLENLRSLGFRPLPAPHAQSRGPLYFAGTPEQRLADFHAAFTHPGTSIIASVRGGYGSNYLLDGLDLDLIRRHPKPFFAYSDLTGIQLFLLDHLGLPAFHGPMVAADFSRDHGVHLASFRAAISGKPYSFGPDEGLRTLHSGTARGTLYGGCLSIIVSLLGTPWEPATEGKLLFLEDTGAKPYQIDRMLWQLRHADKFANIRGIIFGEMLDCASPGAPANLLEDAILSALGGLDIPIAVGLRSGHVSRQNVTLIFGIEAELDASGANPQLRLLQPAVKP